MRDKIREALSFIPAEDRETWVRMGMAVKNELGEDGFDVWNQWGQTALSYNERSSRAVWRSIRSGGGVTSGTLYHEAKALGWVDSGGFRVETSEERAERERLSKAREAIESAHREDGYNKAAMRANNIIRRSKPELHAYLDKKGFSDHKALVWRPTETENLLVIPMRHKGKICGCQLITRDGEKKFLTGQRVSGASLIMGSMQKSAKEFWCEGFATGLSLQKCLSKVCQAYRINICFSAGNVARMAINGFVIADNDISGTGKNAAETTGLPFWMPPKVEQDFNDFHMEVGTYAASQVLKDLLFVRRCR
jgi:putative DNA primase/helicase